MRRTTGALLVLACLLFSPSSSRGGAAPPMAVCGEACRRAQKNALEQLYLATNGAKWNAGTNRGWMTDEDHCTWFGVGCCGGSVCGIVGGCY